MMRRVCSLLLVVLLLNSCNNSTEEPTLIDNELVSLLETNAPAGEGLSFYQFPESDDYQNIPNDPNNPITQAKVDLGRMLFHETGIAIDPKDPNNTGTYSCASCHHAQAGFQAGVAQGIGEGGEGFGVAGELRVKQAATPEDSIDVQPVRTPSALNIAYQTNVLWNGQFGATGVNVGTEINWLQGTPTDKNNLGFEGTETQAIAGLDVHRQRIDGSLCETNAEYVAAFAAAFPDLPENERINNITGGLAIAAYERTLLANRSPWQEWLAGDTDALTPNQKEGAMLFFGEAGCVACHTGPALNTMTFHALGFNDLQGFQFKENDMANRGRGIFIKDSDEFFKFKVPQLYNLKDSPFYGHGASFTSVKDVIEYKNAAVLENAAVPEFLLAAEFKPLDLNAEEIEALVDFIENGLYDPALERYVPQSIPSGNCFPNNDEPSKVDLGCI